MAAVPYFQLRKGAPFDRRPRLSPASIIATGSFGGVGAFQEFYCTNAGSNVNSGDDENAASYYTTTNGSWDNLNNVFTPTDGTNPAAAGVQAGRTVSIYIDAATLTTLVALVTSVENAANGRIFVSGNSKAGPGTATSATARTLKAGGSWFGPTGSVTFPFNVNWAFTNLVTVLAGKWVRINLKNDHTYNISAGLNPSSQNTIVQGYSITPGDGGKATIDGGANIIVLVTVGIGNNIFADLIASNNRDTPANQAFQTSSQHTWFFRCVVHDIGGNGFDFGNSGNVAIECEAYACNLSNTSLGGGFVFGSNCSILYCISHDNAGSNSNGFVLNASASGYFLNGCIADSNGGSGFHAPQAGFNGSSLTQNCDFYNNGLDGIFNGNTTVTSLWLIRSSNFVKNGRFGFNSPNLTTGRVMGYMMNCGFGTGSQGNGAGFYRGNDMMFLVNEVRYASGITPYLDPTIGRFDVIEPAAIAAGAGAFTTTQGGYGPTVGYPDIGAAQAQGAVTFWAGSDIDLPFGYIGYSYIFDWLFPLAETISLQSGSLPNGLSLAQVSANEWRISGTPTTLGSFTAVLRATIGTSTGDATFNVTILADPDEGTGFASNF